MVFVFVFFFNIVKSKDVASGAPFAPSDAWQSSLLWMKNNTPEPFGDTDAYYQLYELPPDGKGYEYPQSAYGVTSWWDYGYWITRIAHRLPNTNPSQDPDPIKKTAELFLSSNETRVREIVKELGSSYIIADYAMLTNKFWAIVTWAEQEQNKYIGIYYVTYESQLVPVQLFLPEYYSNLIVRLYNFDGKAVTNETPMVVSYEEKVDKKSGNTYRQIVDVDEFSSYKEAIDYINSNTSGKYDIVSRSPFVSPIPLEAIKDYKTIYSSEFTVSVSDNDSIPEVKIFEYTGNRSD